MYLSEQREARLSLEQLAFFRKLPFLQPRKQVAEVPAKVLQVRLGLQSQIRRLGSVPIGNELFIHIRLGTGCRKSFLIFKIVGQSTSLKETQIELLSFEGPPPSFAVGTRLKCRGVSAQTLAIESLTQDQVAMYQFLQALI
jgi:hypothetical protein